MKTILAILLCGNAIWVLVLSTTRLLGADPSYSALQIVRYCALPILLAVAATLLLMRPAQALLLMAVLFLYATVWQPVFAFLPLWPFHKYLSNHWVVFATIIEDAVVLLVFATAWLVTRRAALIKPHHALGGRGSAEPSS